MAAKQKQTSELEAMFAEVKVGEYTIKPWTVKQVVRLAPLLSEIITVLKGRGFAFTGEDVLEKELTPEMIASVIGDIGQFVPTIIAGTLDIDQSDAEDMFWGVAAQIVVCIIQLNWDHVKNLLGLVPALNLGPNQTLPETPSNSPS